MPGRRVRDPMRRNVADIRIGSRDDLGGLVRVADTGGATGGADACAQVGAEKKGREEEGEREVMSFIVRLLLLLAFIGVICAVVVSILAVVWMYKKLKQKQR
jgi:hypothetical protein